MASLQGWSEGILLSLLFAFVITGVVVEMNGLYDKEYTVPFSDDSNSQTLFIEYQDNSKTQIDGGEVLLDASQGITLKSSWGLIKDVVSIMWRFLNGGWIENTISYMYPLGIFGSALAVTLRVLWVISIVFSILYLLFKVTT